MIKYNNKTVIIFLFFWQFVNAQLGLTATNDFDTAEINTELKVAAPGVLSNDTGLDLDNLKVTSVSVNKSTYPIGKTINLNAGNLTLYADGSFNFNPSANYTGDVTEIEYTVSNGTLTSSATLFLTVEKITDLLKIVYYDGDDQSFSVDKEYKIKYRIYIKNESTARDYHENSLVKKIKLTNELKDVFGDGCLEIDEMLIYTINRGYEALTDPYPLEFDDKAINPDFLNGKSNSILNKKATENLTLYPRQLLIVEFCVTIKAFCNDRKDPTEANTGIDFTTVLKVTSTTSEDEESLLLKDFHSTAAIVRAGLFIPKLNPSANFDGSYSFTNTVIITNEGSSTAKNINFNMGLGDFIKKEIKFKKIVVSQITDIEVTTNNQYDGNTNTLLLDPNNSLDRNKTIILEVTFDIETFSSPFDYCHYFHPWKSKRQGDQDGYNDGSSSNKLKDSYVIWRDDSGNHLNRYYTVFDATEAVSSKERCNSSVVAFMNFSFLSFVNNSATILAIDDAPNGILEHKLITFQLTLTNTSEYVEIKNLQLKDNNLNTKFTILSAPSIVRSTAKDNPTINKDYNGTTDSNIFVKNTGVLLTKQSITVQFTILFMEDFSGTYTSFFTATDPKNIIVESSSSVNINTELDNDADGISNANDIDDDNDGIPDILEYEDKKDPLGDLDTDYIPNYRDNDFGSDANKDGIIDVFDFDNDGVPNHFDLDSDNDGILDIVETNNTTADTDNDGRTNSFVGDNGLDNSLETNDTFNAVISYTIPNTDKTGNFNFLDIDADADGIVDHIEAQTTDSYIYPSNEVDANGINTAFPKGIVPIDTDNDAIFDYMDSNSDNDIRDDKIEAWDIDSNGTADTTARNIDTDKDGLDDAYDIDLLTFNPTNGQHPTSFPNIDIKDTSEIDWREMMDTILLMNSVSVTEGQNLVFTFSLVGKNDNTISIFNTSDIDIIFWTVNGTSTPSQYNIATAPYDYNFPTQKFRIPADVGFGKLIIKSNEDSIFEPNEMFTLYGTVNSNNTKTKEIKAIGTILDNDNPPSITMNNSTANEGVDLEHTITISHPSSTPIEIAVATSDGTAVISEDYTAVIQNLSIASTIDPNKANTQTAPFYIPTLIDNTNETDEEYLNVIGTVNSDNVGMQDLLKTGTIMDIDPYPIIHVDDQTVVEGNPLVFTIRLLNPDLKPLKNHLPIELEIETVSETARASEDYQSVFTAVTIPALSAESATQEVITIEDRLNEDTETMLLKVTDTLSASFKVAYGTGSIKDNDFPNLFSPNSDGKSDVFHIKGIEEFPDFKILIIDRWGSNVFDYSNNGRTNPIWWDGTSKGKPVIKGVYFYTLEYNNGITPPKTGFIQLIR